MKVDSNEIRNYLLKALKKYHKPLLIDMISRMLIKNPYERVSFDSLFLDIRPYMQAF